MPVYHYSALDDVGRTVRGQMEASSEAALETALRRHGHWLTQARERRAAARENPGKRGNRPVARRLLIEFFLQTNLQLRSGVSLVDALAFGLDEGTSLAFREVQRDILARIKAGSAFSEALEAHPRTFAPLVINLIRAGESSGRLAETCLEIRRYYEWLDRLLGDIRQAMLYPTCVLAAATAFFFLVFTFLIPRFAEVLGQMQVRLPWLTKAFLGLSKFMLGHSWLVGGVSLAVILLFRFGPRLSLGFARLVDRWKLALPVYGGLHHLICLARVAQNLAVLYRAGIPVLQALRLCRALAGNRLVEDALLVVETSVNAGRPMHQGMKDEPIFSRLMVQMVAVGESTGTLGDSLEHVAEYYNDTVPRQVKKLLSIMEPLMIVGLIIMVGMVALAVFLPIASALDAK